LVNLINNFKAHEINEYSKKNAVIMVPLAVLEQHSYHLPISTDYDITERVVAGISERLGKEISHLVTPVVWTGYVMEYMLEKFPVGISIKLETLIELLKDIMESFLAMGFEKIILVNGHGGNVAAIPVAMRYIQDKYRVCPAAIPLVYAMADKKFVNKIRKSDIGGMCHAGELETSLMLYFKKDVDMDRASDRDKMKYQSKYVGADVYGSGSKVMWSTWCYEDSKTGALGDPTVATKETGGKIFGSIVNNCTDFIKEYYYHNKY